MKKPTTLKQRKFIRALIRTLSPTEAAMQTYHCKNRLSARVIASQNLSKLNISMTELMDSCGLGIERDLADIERLSKAKIKKHFLHEGKIVCEKKYDDNDTQTKILNLRLKLKGYLKDNPIIDQSQHTHLTQIYVPAPYTREELLAKEQR